MWRCLDNRPNDGLGPAGRQDESAGDIGALRTDRLVTPNPDGVNRCRIDRSAFDGDRGDLGGQIDRVPSGQGPVGNGEGTAHRSEDWDRHDASLLHCAAGREIPMSTVVLAQNMIVDADAASLGLLVLRVCAGVAMAAHGYQKFFKGGKISGTAGWFDSMGMRPGRVHAVLAATTELGAGLLFALGLLTPLAAMAIVALMFVAGYTVHWENGFMSAKDGIELNFIYAVLAVAVATIGPGEFSVDHHLDLIECFDGTTGLLIAAVGGVGAALAQLGLFYRPPND